MSNDILTGQEIENLPKWTDQTGRSLWQENDLHDEAYAVDAVPCADVDPLLARCQATIRHYKGQRNTLIHEAEQHILNQQNLRTLVTKLEKRVSELESALAWVPVSERLPETMRHVEVTLHVHEESELLPEGPQMAMGTHDGSDWFDLDFNDLEVNDPFTRVIAWRYPTPYQPTSAGDGKEDV